MIAAKKGNKSKTTTTPSFTPEQQNLHSQLGGSIADRLRNPVPINVTGTRNRLRSQVGSQYDSISERMEAANVGRGFGRSGSSGSGRRQLEIARADKMGDIEAQLEEYINNIMIRERESATSAALQYTQPRGGSETVSTGAWGPGVSSAITSGTSDAAFLYALSKMKMG